jgi:hypothetical protein
MTNLLCPRHARAIASTVFVGAFVVACGQSQASPPVAIADGGADSTVATDAPTDALTDALTDAPTDALTDAPTDALTDAPTDDACAPSTHAFGACTGGVAIGGDGGGAPPGASCATDDDCAPACCPCADGPVQYSFSACFCGRCASICDPSNDSAAPACSDAGGPSPIGCLRCSQILNEALADGDDLSPLACDGAASEHWSALSACVTAACGGDCPSVQPTSACAACLDRADSLEGGSDEGTGGGCATEENSCLSN